MIKICHLTIDHPHQPVSLLRVLPYASISKLRKQSYKILQKRQSDRF